MNKLEKKIIAYCEETNTPHSQFYACLLDGQHRLFENEAGFILYLLTPMWIEGEIKSCLNIVAIAGEETLHELIEEQALNNKINNIIININSSRNGYGKALKHYKDKLGYKVFAVTLRKELAAPPEISEEEE